MFPTVVLLPGFVGVESKLQPPVQGVIRRIFDVTTMAQALVEFEIDSEKMPLGKLSKEHMRVGAVAGVLVQRGRWGDWARLLRGTRL